MGAFDDALFSWSHEVEGQPWARHDSTTFNDVREGLFQLWLAMSTVRQQVRDDPGLSGEEREAITDAMAVLEQAFSEVCLLVTGRPAVRGYLDDVDGSAADELIEPRTGSSSISGSVLGRSEELDGRVGPGTMDHLLGLVGEVSTIQGMYKPFGWQSTGRLAQRFGVGPDAHPVLRPCIERLTTVVSAAAAMRQKKAEVNIGRTVRDAARALHRPDGPKDGGRSILDATDEAVLASIGGAVIGALHEVDEAQHRAGTTMESAAWHWNRALELAFTRLRVPGVPDELLASEGVGVDVDLLALLASGEGDGAMAQRHLLFAEMLQRVDAEGLGSDGRRACAYLERAAAHLVAEGLRLEESSGAGVALEQVRRWVQVTKTFADSLGMDVAIDGRLLGLEPTDGDQGLVERGEEYEFLTQVWGEVRPADLVGSLRQVVQEAMDLEREHDKEQSSAIEAELAHLPAEARELREDDASRAYVSDSGQSLDVVEVNGSFSDGMEQFLAAQIPHDRIGHLLRFAERAMVAGGAERFVLWTGDQLRRWGVIESPDHAEDLARCMYDIVQSDVQSGRSPALDVPSVVLLHELADRAAKSGALGDVVDDDRFRQLSEQRESPVAVATERWLRSADKVRRLEDFGPALIALVKAEEEVGMAALLRSPDDPTLVGARKMLTEALVGFFGVEGAPAGLDASGVLQEVRVSGQPVGSLQPPDDRSLLPEWVASMANSEPPSDAEDDVAIDWADSAWVEASDALTAVLAVREEELERCVGDRLSRDLAFRFTAPSRAEGLRYREALGRDVVKTFRLSLAADAAAHSAPDPVAAWHALLGSSAVAHFSQTHAPEFDAWLGGLPTRDTVLLADKVRGGSPSDEGLPREGDGSILEEASLRSLPDAVVAQVRTAESLLTEERSRLQEEVDQVARGDALRREVDDGRAQRGLEEVDALRSKLRDRVAEMAGHAQPPLVLDDVDALARSVRDQCHANVTSRHQASARLQDLAWQPGFRGSVREELPSGPYELSRFTEELAASPYGRRFTVARALVDQVSLTMATIRTDALCRDVGEAVVGAHPSLHDQRPEVVGADVIAGLMDGRALSEALAGVAGAPEPSAVVQALRDRRHGEPIGGRDASGRPDDDDVRSRDDRDGHDPGGPDRHDDGRGDEDPGGGPGGSRPGPGRGPGPGRPGAGGRRTGPAGERAPTERRDASGVPSTPAPPPPPPDKGGQGRSSRARGPLRGAPASTSRPSAPPSVAPPGSSSLGSRGEGPPRFAGLPKVPLPPAAPPSSSSPGRVDGARSGSRKHPSSPPPSSTGPSAPESGRQVPGPPRAKGRDGRGTPPGQQPQSGSEPRSKPRRGGRGSLPPGSAER